MSLRLRIVAIIFLIGTAITVLSTWWSVSTSLDASRPQITRNESFLLEMLTDLSVDAALTGEYTRLQPYIYRVAESPDVLRAMLADRDDRIVVASSDGLEGSALPERVDGDHSYWRVRDVEATGERLGLLVVEFSTVALERLEQAAIVNGMIIVGVGTSLSLLLAWLGASVAVGRLSKLNTITRDIANGNTLVSPIVPGRDEVSQLSMSIQAIVARIEHAETERLHLRGGTDEVEQRLRAVTAAVPDPVIIKDAAGRWDETNLAARRLLRLEGLPWRGKTDEDLALLVPPLAGFFRAGTAADQTAIAKREGITSEECIPDPQGKDLHLSLTRLPLFDAAGKATGIALVGKDRTGERIGHDRAIGDRGLIDTLMDNVADAVVIADATGRVESINREVERLTGWTAAEARGCSLNEVLPLLDNQSHRPLAEALREAARDGAAIAGGNPVALLCRDGSETPVTANAAPIVDSQGIVRGQVVAVRGGGHAHAQATSGAMATGIDPLTGLLNAQGFEQVLQHTLAAATDDQRHHILCLVDLDGFHQLNADIGRFAADELLRQLGRRLRDSVRSVDPVARLGADRYAVLLPHCPLEQARLLAAKLLQAVTGLRLSHQQQSIAVTAGIAVLPMTAAAPLAVDWLKAAEATCRAAKTGDDEPIRWDSHWATRLAHQHQERDLIDQVRRALKADRLELYAQPVRAMKTGRPAYRELLLRMPVDDGKPLVAGQFLALAERDGLGVEIDRWVLDAVAAAWGDRRLPRDDGIVGINLTAASLTDDGFADRAIALLAAAGMPADRVCFEVRASVVASDPVAIGDTLGALVRAGSHIALQNVTADTAIFGLFKQLAPDFVKIDGPLVAAVDGDTLAATLVESIHKAATVQGIATMATWVEDVATLDRVKRFGVAYVQGQGVEPVQPLESLLRGDA